MFSLLGTRTPILTSHADKIAWSEDMNELVTLRTTGTVRQVVELLQRTRRPRFTEAIENKERKLAEWLASETREENRLLSELEAFKNVAYAEVIALKDFLNGITPFATKHGVKGAQFENVIVVFGRGWNQYNFNQFLEWVSRGVPAGKQETFERNRNLFYVACSRPKKRLALLFTQKLSDIALETIEGWAGAENVSAL
jgi:DNA helicase-2/ATP-dependent DNA helicase PcrA